MSSGWSSSPSPSHSSSHVTTERTVEAFTWFRKFLIAQSSHSSANSLTAGLEPTPASVQAVESIRALIEQRIQSAESTATDAKKQAEQYRRQAEAWRDAGALQLLSELDPDAVAEVMPLCDIAVALRWSPYQCLSRVVRTAAVGELAAEYLKSVEEVEMMKEQVAEAQAVLREACALRGRAVKGLEEAEQVVETQKEQAKRFHEKAERLELKEQEYNSAAGDWKEKVRRSGVTEAIRHETIVRGGKQLATEEKELQELQAELERYQNLPPDLAECQDILANLEAEIEAVDREINSAISSMGR